MSLGVLMAEVKIPFMSSFRQKMEADIKTMTSRTRSYGQPGDHFYVFGHRFDITEVVTMLLGDVAEKYYIQEGCDSPEHFKQVWAGIHFNKGFVAEQPVRAHTFRRVLIEK